MIRKGSKRCRNRTKRRKRRKIRQSNYAMTPPLHEVWIEHCRYSPIRNTVKTFSFNTNASKAKIKTGI